ncbi:hypothetical protein M674_03920 [Neisseria gonorrhoeae SK708]|nr:hypothetical protein M674_03920 [Neisseria gonorrhoeae SK708]
MIVSFKLLLINKEIIASNNSIAKQPLVEKTIAIIFEKFNAEEGTLL